LTRDAVLRTAVGLRSTMKLTGRAQASVGGRGEERSMGEARPKLGHGSRGTTRLAHAGEGRDGGMEVGCYCGLMGGRGRDSSQVSFSIF
jgi:hypothetical protein